MFKLLDKKDILHQKNLEKKTEIEEGAKLAKRIDELRKTYAEEQEKLAKFRVESLKSINNEINSLIEKKQQLIDDIEKLETNKHIIEKIKQTLLNKN